MGISTIQSYQGAKIFEAVGIDRSVIDRYFTGTTSPIGGITLDDIAKDVEYRHDKAFDPLELGEDTTLDSSGYHKMRSGKEEHLYNPNTIHMLQKSTWTGDYQLFKQYEHRKVSSEKRVLLGETQEYEPLCRECYQKEVRAEK